jgi:hypothetical protein
MKVIDFSLVSVIHSSLNRNPAQGDNIGGMPMTNRGGLMVIVAGAVKSDPPAGDVMLTVGGGLVTTEPA